MTSGGLPERARWRIDSRAMRSRRAARLAFVTAGFVPLGVLTAGSVIVACDEPMPTVRPCGRIPDDGCPRSRADACDDPLCAGVYACVEGVWTLERVCRDAVDGGRGVPPDGSVDARAEDAAFGDGSDRGGGRCPPLRETDCSLERARACASGCCGCDDVFSCEPDGWVARGYCDEGTLRFF
jgi:hypothetical protein